MNITVIHHLISNTLTPEERAEVLECFRAHGTKAEFFNVFEKVWQETGDEMPEDIQSEIWKRIDELTGCAGADGSSEVCEPVTLNRRPNVLKVSSWKLGSAVAAAVIGLLVLFCGFLYRNYEHRQAELAQRCFVVTADRGQRAEIVLPDGTKVWLNSDTKLSYFADYGVEERRVKLIGEASFAVAKDAEHRFLVDARGVTTEALGTEFNVSAYGDASHIVTTLYEGSVRVSWNNEETVLKPNEKAIIDLPSGSLAVESDASGESEASWRRCELNFNGESLREIVAVLSRTFDTTIVIDDKSLEEEQFVGTIRNTDLLNILDMIGLTTAVVYEVKGDTILLSRP